MNTIFYESKHGVGPDYFALETNTDFSYPMHIHNCYELILLHEGSMRVRVERKDHLLSAGDMILIKPNSIHSLETPDSSRHSLCIFAPELISAISGNLMRYRLSSPVLKDVALPYRALFEGMREDANIATVKGFLYSMCGLFYEKLDRSGEDTFSGDMGLLRSIFRYVEDHMSTPCSLSALAEELDYAPAYLSRVFRSSVGMSYSAYVRNVKINHACYLLRNTDDSVMSISQKSGYSSIATFNHNFKQLTGCNPTEYRDNLRDGK